jgi:hypothetical protein
MMPAKDWETINDDWAQHDFAKGAQGGDLYPGILAARYGAVKNLADFTRKAQLMNYEAYRAMYEGREAKLFAPATGVITWMSSPAQPSFVWQLYHYDLEPNASLFAVKKACEPVHVQWDAVTNAVEVVNETPSAMKGVAKATVYALDGAVVSTKEYEVNAAADAATSLGVVTPGAAVSFLKLEFKDAEGALLSQNFYWLGAAGTEDDLRALDGMKPVALQAKVSRTDADGKTLVSVTLRNPGNAVALMAHVQLRRKDGERVLPVFYSDNYVSLTGGEERTITMEADAKDLHSEDALVVVDGWNTTVTAVQAKGVAIETNAEALGANSPLTGLPLATTGLR